MAWGPSEGWLNPGGRIKAGYICNLQPAFTKVMAGEVCNL
jgi:hypothetical protein